MGPKLAAIKTELNPHWRGSNIWLPLAMVVYAGAAGLISVALGYPENFQIANYTKGFLLGDSVFAGVLGSAALALSVIAFGARLALRTSETPLWCSGGGFRFANYLGRLLAALPFLLAWPVFMSGFTAFKVLINETLPFTWDNFMAEADAFLHFGRPLYEWVAFDKPEITLLIENAYSFWGVLLVAVPFFVALRRFDCPRRNRYLLTQIIMMALLGNVAAAIFASGGPFYLEFTATGRNLFTPLFDYLRATDPDGKFSAYFFQKYLWASYQKGTIGFGTGISAFPSIHVGVAFLYVLHFWRSGHILRWASVVFWAVIMVGSVHLGWHYSVDGYFSMAVTAAIYFGIERLQKKKAVKAVDTTREAAEPALQPEQALAA